MLPSMQYPLHGERIIDFRPWDRFFSDEGGCGLCVRHSVAKALSHAIFTASSRRICILPDMLIRTFQETYLVGEEGGSPMMFMQNAETRKQQDECKINDVIDLGKRYYDMSFDVVYQQDMK